MKDLKNAMDLFELLKNPEEIKALITLAVSVLKPVLYHGCSEGMAMYKDYVANDEWKALVAENKFKIYQSYINAGFTEEQAMSLLLTETHEAVMRAHNMTKSVVDGVQKGLTD